VGELVLIPEIRLTFQSKSSDLQTAKHVSDKINNLLGPGVATSLECESITGSAPRDASQRVTFYPFCLEIFEVKVAEERARIVLILVRTIIIVQHSKVPPRRLRNGSLTGDNKRGSAGDWARWNSNRRENHRIAS